VLQFKDLAEAMGRIRPFIAVSPLVPSNHLSERLQVNLFLKLENLQVTGSFKVRGALNKILLMSKEERDRGVVTASAGNHAQGVAWAAGKLGIEATVVMPRHAPIAKVLATRGYGAQVIREGDTYDDCARRAMELAKARGATLIHAFDDPQVIAGQGTLGIELCQQMGAFDAILIPAGGGGLIAGVSLAIKTLRPNVRVIGVQSEKAPAFAESWKKGERVELPPGSTLCDGIAVAKPGEITFQMAQGLVDEMFLVKEEFVEAAIVTFLERKHLVVEGAGAAPLALFLQEEGLLRGKKVVLLVSGGNLDLQWLDRLIQRGAMGLSRRMRLKALLPDVPGSLAKATSLIASTGANILQVFHDRLAPGHQIQFSEVEFDLEIEGPEHAEALKKLLEENGISLIQEVGAKPGPWRGSPLERLK